MNYERHRQPSLQYTPEAWRDDDYTLSLEGHTLNPLLRSRTRPDVLDQCRLLDLLGRINYKILSGKKVYIEVGGVVYKTLYGGYWRSVFTGIEHYLLRCQEVSGSVWTEENSASGVVDLPIVYSNNGWTARGHSLSFMLTRDQT